MSKTDNTSEIRVNGNWARFIKWVAEVIPNGTVPVKFVNGNPVKLAGRPEPDIRFDKEITSSYIGFQPVKDREEKETG